MNFKFSSFLMATLVSTMAWADGAPDLATLSRSGYIISPGAGSSSSYRTHQTWANATKLMTDVTAYDAVVEKIASVICGGDQNKSVLLVGEPSDTYRYIFARFAMNKNLAECQRLAHVEVDISAIEAGHHYVGDVDDYWKNSILAPSDSKDVVLYFDSLDAVVGLGSHSNDNNGIETEYVANFTSGRMRTVAFANQYEYQELLTTRNAYVPRSFSEVIYIDALSRPQLEQFVQSYIKILTPWITLQPREGKYLYDTVDYYQPNVFEPQRSLSVVEYLARKYASGGQSEDLAVAPIESAHPYTNSFTQDHEVKDARAQKLRLVFDRIETEASNDSLVISDGNNGTVLQTISGAYATGLTTAWFPTNNLKLHFATDSSDVFWGYKLGKAQAQLASSNNTVLSLDQIREGIFYVAQVPQWLLQRNYQVIKDMRAQLEVDVVGVAEGKDEVVRLAKTGYIVGRTDQKPIASTLFVGSTGTGKSYLAKKTAQVMGMKLITLDMTSYQTPESLDRFVDTVASYLTLYPWAVYLFDEIDKANIQVLDRLYFMLDEGVFYDKHQRPLFARGAFVMMATNTGQDLVIQERNNPELRHLLNQELQKTFRPSFLNRFDSMPIFYPFTAEEFHQLAVVLSTTKTKALKEHYDWDIALDAGTINYLATNGQSIIYGARPMERLMENVISFSLAEFQLNVASIDYGAKIAFTKLSEANKFRVTVNSDKHWDVTVDPRDNNGGGTPLSLAEVNEVQARILKAFR